MIGQIRPHCGKETTEGWQIGETEAGEGRLMSPKARTVLSTIVGVLLVAGVGFGIIVALRTVIHALASLAPAIAAAIIAPAATVIVSVISIVLGKYFESRNLIQKEQREKKIPVYEDLINFVSKIQMSTKAGNTPPSEEEMVNFMSGFTQRIMVWGSDEVLTAFVRFRRVPTDDAATKANPFGLMFSYEQLILAIRRDLGHKNKALSTGDILRLSINDIDQYLPKRKNL